MSEIVDVLAGMRKRWTRVLEPTCGQGSFVRGILDSELTIREIYGVEIQRGHLEKARRSCTSSRRTRVELRTGDVFKIAFQDELSWREKGPLLVVGNPPWVTNSELGSLGSSNVPKKSNLKNLRGIDAMTGESNFDIAEFIWLKLLKDLQHERPTIALLCKTSVARNVLKYAHDTDLPITDAAIRRLDAMEWFGAAVDACLFSVQVTEGDASYEAAVYEDLRAARPAYRIGFVNGQFVADIEAYSRTAFLDGASPMEWRQGVKHDAATVMELASSIENGTLTNKLGEVVNVEPDYLYPLLKGSDLHHERSPRMVVVVTQKRVGEDTTPLKRRAPQLWRYLERHADVFTRRKSPIYNRQPAFSMFGVGDYSFAPHKVAVSGFHKTPHFRAVGPIDGQPVMLDDTCYFVPCPSAEVAVLVTALLNSAECQDFLRAIAFSDAKRPIQKKVLKRINLQALLDHLGHAEVARRTGDTIRALEPWRSAAAAAISASGFALLADRRPE